VSPDAGAVKDAAVQSDPSIRLQISGDTLALDRTIRRQIESEAQSLIARFSRDALDLRVQIGEELDQLHGHRVRCEIRIEADRGRQWVVRDARKDATAAITESFKNARKTIRRTLQRTGLAEQTAAAAAIS
jgi:ribosome-associated translation inhibitor RaiA